jgi:hypothetical protein
VVTYYFFYLIDRHVVNSGITIFSEWDSAATAYVERGIAEVKGKKYPFALRRGE